MRYLKSLVLIAVLAGLVACEGDFRERADGNPREFIVVMDSTKWESATAEAIRDTFGKYIFTLPNAEPNYDLMFMPIRSRQQLERIRKGRNVIFAAPLNEDTNVGRQIKAFLDDGVEARVESGESFAFPIEDQWYKDQYVLILTSTSDSVLAEKIRNSEQALVSSALKKNFSAGIGMCMRRKSRLSIPIRSGTITALWSAFSMIITKELIR